MGSSNTSTQGNDIAINANLDLFDRLIINTMLRKRMRLFLNVKEGKDIRKELKGCRSYKGCAQKQIKDILKSKD